MKPQAIDWSKVPRAAFQFAIETPPQVAAKPEASGDEDPDVEIIGYTGAVMSHPWFGETCIDQATLTMAKPVIGMHLRHDSERVIGARKSMALEAGNNVFRGCFYRAEKDGAEVIRRLSNKKIAYPYQASGTFVPGRVVELAKGQMETVNGRAVTGPAQVWYDTKVHEISLTPFGRDGNTSAELAAEDGGTVDLSGILETQKERTMSKQNDGKPVLLAALGAGEINEEQAAALKAENKAAVDAAKASGVEEGRKLAAPKPATLAELKAEFPEHPAFVIDQAEKGASLEAAKGNFAAVLKAEVKDLTRKIAAGKAPANVVTDGAEDDAANNGMHAGADGDEDEDGKASFSEDQAKAFLAAHPDIAKGFDPGKSGARKFAAYATRVLRGSNEDEELLELLRS